MVDNCKHSCVVEALEELDLWRTFGKFLQSWVENSIKIPQDIKDQLKQLLAGPLKDQYGHLIPVDLVALPDFRVDEDVNPDDCDIDEYRQQPDVVMRADWYEDSRGFLYASWDKIQETVEPGDFDPPQPPLVRINTVLKRFGNKDGFYHA